MRLLIKFQVLRDSAYELKYHNKVQGFIYDLLRDTEYAHLHDVSGYKYFSFSNIFPEGGNLKKGFKQGETANLLISSPNSNFIKSIYEKLNNLKESQEKIGIGEYFFRVKELIKLAPKLSRSCTLQTATPIIMRIPKEKFSEYNIDSNRAYVDWKSGIDFKAFLGQIESNLFKKYNKFYNVQVEPFPLFEQFTFKKPVVNHVILNGKEVKFIGTLWDFTFNYLNDEQLKLLQFGMETGLGELNSLGFGFINLKKR